jgi:hypothetical protein
MTVRTPPKYVAQLKAEDRRSELTEFGTWLLNAISSRDLTEHSVEQIVDTYLKECS